MSLTTHVSDSDDNGLQRTQRHYLSARGTLFETSHNPHDRTITRNPEGNTSVRNLLLVKLFELQKDNLDLRKRVGVLEDTVEEGFSKLSAEIAELRTLVIGLSPGQSM
jgi:hypothetical protein